MNEFYEFTQHVENLENLEKNAERVENTYFNMGVVLPPPLSYKGSLTKYVKCKSFPKNPIPMKYVRSWPAKLRSELTVFLCHFYGKPE